MDCTPENIGAVKWIRLPQKRNLTGRTAEVCCSTLDPRLGKSKRANFITSCFGVWFPYFVGISKSFNHYDDYDDKVYISLFGYILAQI